MKERFVQITMEVPVSSLDFSDCGDGCGQVDGLGYAKFKGARIERFDPSSVPVAERAMLEWLGEPVPVVAAPVSGRPRYTQLGRRTPKHAEYREADLADDLVTQNSGIR